MACSLLCPIHAQLPTLQAKASYGVKPGDVICCSVLPPPPLEAAPEALPLEIVYEDAHLLVINKVGFGLGLRGCGHLLLDLAG